MAAVPIGLITVPFIEKMLTNSKTYLEDLFSVLVFLVGTFVAFWLGIGATMPIRPSINIRFLLAP